MYPCLCRPDKGRRVAGDIRHVRFVAQHERSFDNVKAPPAAFVRLQAQAEHDEAGRVS